MQNNKHHTTKAVLKLLDIPLLETLDSSVGGLLDSEIKELNKNIQQKIENKKKQK